jgi:hypothetical protein
MSECFQISFISRKDKTTSANLEDLVTDFSGLHMGDNNKVPSRIDFLDNREINVSIFPGEDCDFDELLFSVSGYKLTESNFDRELEKIDELASTVFAEVKSTVYALCSYELNGYLLSSVKSVDAVEDILSKFPVVYRAQFDKHEPSRRLNLQAQDLFSEESIGFDSMPN